MNNFFTKLMHPKTYIRVLIANPDRSLRGFNVVPKGQTVTCGNREFILTDDSPWMKTGRNVPCYILAHNRVKPLNLYAENGPESVRRDSEKSPEDLKAFIDSNAFQRMARKKGVGGVMIYLVIGAAILIGGFYLIYTKITEQQATIDALKTLLETIVGA